MNHLGDDRWLTLSREGAALPTAEEDRHLASCPACAARFTEERALSALLGALPREGVPPGFARALAGRYRQAMASRAAVRGWSHLVWTVGIFLSWWAGCLWLGWVTASRNLVDLALVFSKAFTLVRIGWILAVESRWLWLGPLTALVLLTLAVLVVLRSTESRADEIIPARQS